jgi:hypothetical protein
MNRLLLNGLKVMAAAGIIEDPKVQARLLADARTGKLHPSVLTALMAYAYVPPSRHTRLDYACRARV